MLGNHIYTGMVYVTMSTPYHQLTVSCGSINGLYCQKSRPETTRVRYALLNLQGTMFMNFIIRVSLILNEGPVQQFDSLGICTLHYYILEP